MRKNIIRQAFVTMVTVLLCTSSFAQQTAKRGPAKSVLAQAIQHTQPRPPRQNSFADKKQMSMRQYDIPSLFKKQRVETGDASFPTLVAENISWKVGDLAFTNISTGIWKQERATGSLTKLVEGSSGVNLSDIEIDSQGNLFFLDKGNVQTRAGNIYLLNNDGLFYFWDPNSSIVFNPFGIYLTNDRFLYVTAWITSNLGTTAFIEMIDLRTNTWTDLNCTSIASGDQGSFPQDLFNVGEWVIFADQTPGGLFLRGPGIYQISNNDRCPNYNGAIYYNGEPLRDPTATLSVNLIRPVSSIVVADNSILTNQGGRLPGFVVLNLDKFENNMLRLDDWWLGSPFSKITDIAADALQSNTFFIADQGAKKIFRVRQLALHNFQITDVYSTNVGWPVGIAVAYSNVTSVEDIADGSQFPDGFSLMQNYPNPFNAGTVIKYGLTESMQVKLMIFNVAGEIVRTLVDEFQTSGIYTKRWDGRGDSGRPLASGIYFYKISAGDFVQTRKMILLQ